MIIRNRSSVVFSLLIGGGLLIAPSLANADETQKCGTHFGAGKSMFVGAKSPRVVASCQQNGVCIITIGAKPETGSPNGILFVSRTIKNKQWDMRFTANEGFQENSNVIVKADGKEPIVIKSSDLLLQKSSGFHIVRRSLVETVASYLSSVNEAQWVFVNSSGKSRIAKLPVEDLIAARQWIGCKISQKNQ